MSMSKNDPRNLAVPRRGFIQKAAAGLGAAALGGIGAKEADAAKPERHWDLSADVVVVGSGAAGLPASICRRRSGRFSVIVVEQNYDIGGHAIESGGNIALGGGTSLQKKYGIEDSPDKMFEDLVNWHDYRFSDREIVRAFCDESVATFDFLLAHGVKFPDKHPIGADGGPQNVMRAQTVTWTGEVSAYSPTGGNGTALMRPLEASARKLGVQILLRHSMTGLMREEQFSGRVLGITATHEGKTLNIQAKRGVVVSTGGHTSNVNFRRIFDPRLTEEYQVVGEPYSRQSGDGEIAAMQVGASLWGAGSQTVETQARSHIFEKPYVIGNQFGYPQGGGKRNENIRNSPVKGIARGIGLQVADFQNLIQVNQFGRRFVNELATGFDWWNPCLEQERRESRGRRADLGHLRRGRERSAKTGRLRRRSSIPTAGFSAQTRCANSREKLSANIRRSPCPARRWRKRWPATIRSSIAARMRISENPCRCTRFKRRPFMPRGPRPAFTIAFPACASTEKRRSSICGAKSFRASTAREKRQADLTSTAWQNR